jgi:hypothetical protein
MTWRRENTLPYWDSNSDPAVVQPVASRYTDYATLCIAQYYFTSSCPTQCIGLGLKNFKERKRNECFPEVVVATVGIALEPSHGLIITPNIKEQNLFQGPVPKSNFREMVTWQNGLIGRSGRSICWAELVRLVPIGTTYINQPDQRPICCSLSLSVDRWLWWTVVIQCFVASLSGIIGLIGVVGSYVLDVVKQVK